MRRHLSNMDEVAHYWAHQLQEYGESSNIFFNGNTIYSYGYHFKCGVITTNWKGERAYVLNSNTYSSSTCKHQYAALRAIPGYQTIFHIPDCDAPSWNNSLKLLSGYASALRGAMHYLSQIEILIGKQKRARKYDYSGDIMGQISKFNEWVEYWELDTRKKWAMSDYGEDTRIYEPISSLLLKKTAVYNIRKKFVGFDTDRVIIAIEIYKALREFGLSPQSQSRDLGFSMSAAVNGVVNRYLGSDVFETIQKRKLSVEKRERQEKLAADIEQLDRWHNDKAYSWHPSSVFERKYGWHTALRLDKKALVVESSKHIVIGIDEAKRLWGIISMFHNKKSFTHQIAVDIHGQRWVFNSYEKDILTAGCHKIPYSEMENIAKQLNLI